MKKTLLIVILSIFVTIGFTSQSWAMGGRKHRGGSGSGEQHSGFTSPIFFDNHSDNHSDNHGEEDNHGEGSQGDHLDDPGQWDQDSEHENDYQGPYSGPRNSDIPIDPGITENNGLPTAPVPEPMTMALMGMGLTGMLLRRNKLAN